jgi:hypothetical protein
MSEITKPAAIDWQSDYGDLENPIRELVYMAEVARFYAHEVHWPSGLTGGHEISQLLFLISYLEDMASELEKT